MKQKQGIKEEINKLLSLLPHTLSQLMLQMMGLCIIRILPRTQVSVRACAALNSGATFTLMFISKKFELRRSDSRCFIIIHDDTAMKLIRTGIACQIMIHAMIARWYLIVCAPGPRSLANDRALVLTTEYRLSQYAQREYMYALPVCCQ